MPNKDQKFRVSKNQKRFLIILCLILSSLIFFYIKVFQPLYNQPLGVELPEFKKTSSVSPTLIKPLDEDTVIPFNDLRLEKPFLPLLPTLTTPSKLPKTNCGYIFPDMIVVLIGTDTGEGYLRGLADVIKIARLDFVEMKVQIVSIPRDIWVKIPTLEKHNITNGKINQAFFYGNLYRSVGEGPILLAETLFHNFGIPIDHYVAVNMGIFVYATNLIGGVYIDLPEYVFDENRKIYYPPGANFFTGEKLLQFARIRNPSGDLLRNKRQNLILTALFKKLISPENIARSPELIKGLSDYYLTDFSLNEIQTLSCFATKINIEDITYIELNESLLTPSTENGWVFYPDTEEIRDFFTDFIHGNTN